ncbi:hypothetical protein ES703_30885 [subsurface metagenome]
MFGKDFFRIMRFIIALLKLMAEIWGDDNDKEAAKENGIA